MSRFSFIGLDPFLMVTSYGQKISIKQLFSGREDEITLDPFELLRYLLKHYQQDHFEFCAGQPPFWSGGIGYLGYELGHHIEKLPSTAIDDLNLPDLYFVLQLLFA